MKTSAKLSYAFLASLLLISAPLLTQAAQAATQQQIDAAFAPIKSAEDLQTILSQPSALDVLGDDLPAFINSIEFAYTGDQKVSFDKTNLQANLTATQIYQILSLFGLQASIAEYPDALVLRDTDKLLTAPTLPLCDAASPIDLRVILNKKKQAKFSYWQVGNECDGNVELTENTTITYQLVHRKRTPQGLRIVGAGFTNPFDAHIERVTISDDGQSIYLENNIDNLGVGKFQFIFTSEESDLLLVSPDPQVINSGRQ